MLGVLEASTALYLYNAESSMTAVALRDVQIREQLVLEKWRRAQLERQMAEQDAISEDQAIVATIAAFGTSSTTSAVRSEEPKTRADRTIAQLFRFEGLDADWDGNEAAKPLAFSIKDARDFIRALAPESIVPHPTLHADGHVILFIRGEDSYAELEFLGGSHVGFYARRGEKEWTDEFYFDGHVIPAGLLQIGFAT
jgi:hypothetical protein